LGIPDRSLGAPCSTRHRHRWHRDTPHSRATVHADADRASRDLRRSGRHRDRERRALPDCGASARGVVTLSIAPGRRAHHERAGQKRGYELGFGVGIATGYATLGRIGFEGRYDYGAIGNVVILAQRLSAEAKAGQILLSQRVQAAVETDAETTAVGDLALKGFTRPVPAFAAESVKTPARS